MKNPKKPKDKRPLMVAERTLVGSAPKRRVFTKEEQRLAREKAKLEGKKDDERDVSTQSRHNRAKN